MNDVIKKSARQLGRIGGASKSHSKIAASKQNGKLGGRPKKSGGVASAKTNLGKHKAKV